MKILVTGAFNDYKKLSQEFSDQDFVFIQNELEELSIDTSGIEYVICNGLFMHNKIDYFKSLKYIQVTSAGLDRLPMDYISQNDIKVFNARGVYSAPMAEWAICKILDVYKNSFNFNDNQKNHIWKKDRNIEELTGKNVAIIGYGSVGREVAKRLKAFGCNITAVDKYIIDDELLSSSYEIKDIKKAIPQADIIILTLPLTPETENLFNSELFTEINNKPILVNVARGKIINEPDLFKNADKFHAIILDVFESEPLDESSKLWDLSNAILTPHNSFVSTKNDERLYDLVVKNLRSVINE